MNLSLVSLKIKVKVLGNFVVGTVSVRTTRTCLQVICHKNHVLILVKYYFMIQIVHNIPAVQLHPG